MHTSRPPFEEILNSAFQSHEGFTASTTVSFNGTPAAATVVFGTYLQATVPAGATTGFVTVTTSSGILTSNRQFVVARTTMQFDIKKSRQSREIQK